MSERQKKPCQHLFAEVSWWKWSVPKRCQLFSCLTALSACLRENKKTPQPFGLSLRQNKEQIIRFQIRSAAPVYRCLFVIFPVSPCGNSDQCGVQLASLGEVSAVWNKKKSHVENKPSNSQDTRHTSKFHCVFNLLEIRDRPT